MPNEKLIADSIVEDNKRLQDEIDALKAQNDSLSKALRYIPDNLSFTSYEGTELIYLSDAENHIDDILDNSSTQCLAQVKHDAIIAMQHASSESVTTNCRCGSLDDYDSFATRYARDLLTQSQEQNK